MIRDLDTTSDAYVKEAGTWEPCSEIQRRIAGVWVPVWREAVTITATLTVPTVYGAQGSGSATTVTTSTAGITIAGGEPPFTIVWSRVDAVVTPWTIIASSSLSTQFSVDVGPGDIETAEFEAEVTDALGAVATSAIVYATAENYGGYAP